MTGFFPWISLNNSECYRTFKQSSCSGVTVSFKGASVGFYRSISVHYLTAGILF